MSLWKVLNFSKSFSETIWSGAAANLCGHCVDIAGYYGAFFDVCKKMMVMINFMFESMFTAVFFVG